ncbi:MAG: substrate-binding domain-containing protein [Pseudomonadota bacterium]
MPLPTARALLAQLPDTECIFCVSDAPAFGVLSELKTRGYSVPQDIGVAGFGNFEVSRFSSPAISTVTVDPTRIGQLAGELLGTLLNDESPDPAPQRIDIAALPTLRETTRR